MSRPQEDRELEGQLALAEAIRQALLEAALDAHTDAGIRGLCCEGQWEVVVTAMRGFDLAHFLAERRWTEGSEGAEEPRS